MNFKKEIVINIIKFCLREKYDKQKHWLKFNRNFEESDLCFENIKEKKAIVFYISKYPKKVDIPFFETKIISLKLKELPDDIYHLRNELDGLF